MCCIPANTPRQVVAAVAVGVDLGLETGDFMLKLANCENCAPVVEGMKRVRGGAAVIRKEGAKKNGTEKVTSVAFMFHGLP